MNNETVGSVLATAWSVIVRAWSGIGPLVGVAVGAWLTRSWQRKQWTLEAKRTEYRELIGTLSKSVHTLVNICPHPVPGGVHVQTADELLAFEEARVAGY